MAAAFDARDPWIAPGREPTHEAGGIRYDIHLETYEHGGAARRYSPTYLAERLETYERGEPSGAHDGSDAAGYSGVGPDRLPGDATDELF